MDTKHEIRVFNIAEYEEEQEYLRNMHRQGWKFNRIKYIFLYEFIRCEPEDVVYQLDYNLDGLKHKTEYIQLFTDCGWQHIGDYFDYSYFSKPLVEMNAEEEIFNDDASKLEMLKRIIKGRLLPLLIIFFCTICPQLFINSYSHNAFFFIFLIIFSVYCFIFIKVYLKFNSLNSKYGGQ